MPKKVKDRLRISYVPAYLHSLTGETRCEHTIRNWINRGVRLGDRVVKLRSEKLYGLVYTRKCWLDEFIQEINH